MQEKIMEVLKMTEIEKIQRYIARTGVEYKDTSPYHMKIGEAFALARASDNVRAVSLAFEYGRAKGFRAAMSERKAVRG